MSDYYEHEIAGLKDALAESEAENKKLREALEVLARLGNGALYGNSDGNLIAQTALGESE